MANLANAEPILQLTPTTPPTTRSPLQYHLLVQAPQDTIDRGELRSARPRYNSSVNTTESLLKSKLKIPRDSELFVRDYFFCHGLLPLR